MRSHITILGWLQIAIHAIYLVVASFLILGFGAVGAVAASSPGSGNGGIGALIASMGVFLAGIMLVLGVPGIVIGYYILKRAPWARIAGIVLSVLMLLNVT